MPMNLGLGLSLSRRSGGTDISGPPVILGNSNTIVSGGITWTLSAAVDYGQTVDGVAWIIVPGGGVNITARSPAATTESSLAVNGTMKNPLREQQGWHAGVATYNASFNQTFPISVVAGDIIVGAIHSPGAAAGAPRYGVNASYSGLICTSGGYPANTFAPALIGWAGRGTPQAYQFNVASVSFPSYSLTGINYPTVVDTIAKVDRLEIAPAATNADVTTGYETLFTQGLGDGTSNYGQWVARWIGAAGLHLVGDVANSTQKQTLLRALIRHGIQWYDTTAGAASPAAGNGGHWQFHLIPVAAALHYLGRGSQLDSLPTVWPGNFFEQPITYTATRIANLAPHSSTSLPLVSRRRTVTAVSGNDVTFTTDRTAGIGDTPRTNFAGLELVRESDGASALITTNRAASSSTGLDDLTSINTGSDRKGVTIAAQPGSPFLVNDVVYLRRPETIYEGDTDWRALPADWAINPSFAQEYREINKWSDDVLVLRALGIWRQTEAWQSLERYTALANRSGDPSVARDYPTHHDTAGGFTFAQDFWNTHGQTVLGSYPVILTNTTLSGSGTQGTNLTATPAVVAPASGLTRTYQWYRGASAISGATSTTYTVQALDVGNNLSCWETISNASGSQVSRSAAVLAQAVYSVNAVNFDGSTSAYSSGLSGPGASTQGAVVFTFRYATSYNSGTVFSAANGAGAARVAIQTERDTTGGPPTTQGRLLMQVRNSANSNIVNMGTNNGEFLVGQYYTVLISWDTVTQTFVMYKRPDGGSWSAVTPNFAVVTLNGQTEAIGRMGVGTTNGTAGRPTDLDLADLWVGIGQLPDFTSATVRDAFLPTVSKGSNGSLPTGTAPGFFFSGATGTWHTNDGTSGGLALTGTLTTASAQPT